MRCDCFYFFKGYTFKQCDVCFKEKLSAPSDALYFEIEFISSSSSSLRREEIDNYFLR